MGRKPSNVYDFFTRIEPTEDSIESGKNLVRYECKKCQKQYAANATRLAEHLRFGGCMPNFISNQKTSRRSANPPMTSEGALQDASAQLALPSFLETDDLDTDLLLRFSKLSTCAIADAMASIKIEGHLVDVDLIRGYENPLSMNICGPALTVKVLPAKGAAVRKLPFNYIDTTEMGQVIVISAPEGSTTGVFGGLLATAAKARNVAGVVTDGRVRDVQEICTMGFPAFAKGTSIHGQRGATTVADVGCPISVSGCVVRNSDIVRGDANGVIVVPIEKAADVASKAEMVEEQDTKIAEAVQQGEQLQRSFQRFRPKTF